MPSLPFRLGICAGLKVDSQRQLSGSVTARALRQYRLQNTERSRITDVRLGRREIQAVNNVGERGFEAHPLALADAKVLRQSQA